MHITLSSRTLHFCMPSCVSLVSRLPFVPSYLFQIVSFSEQSTGLLANYYFKPGFLKLRVPLSQWASLYGQVTWPRLCCFWEVGLRNHHRKMSILLLLLLWIKKSFVSDAEVFCVLPASMWQVNLLTCKVGKKNLRAFTVMDNFFFFFSRITLLLTHQPMPLRPVILKATLVVWGQGETTPTEVETNRKTKLKSKVEARAGLRYQEAWFKPKTGDSLYFWAVYSYIVDYMFQSTDRQF